MQPETRNFIINGIFQKNLFRQDSTILEKLQQLLIQRNAPILSPLNRLEVIKTIGYGAYGIVELVSYEKKLYAHKRPRVDFSRQQKILIEEALRLTDIDDFHLNIQRLCFFNPQTYGFLMDYCACGPMDRIIEDSRSEYTLVDVLHWVYQLADAISFLHSKKLMHRDIKVQNILLKHNCRTIVLTDYGTATRTERTSLTTQVGTLITMAPEVFNGTQYGEQCDIYSWTIVFWQLLSKQLLPYATKNQSFIFDVAKNNLRPSKLKNCPQLLNALLYRSWHLNSKERPTLSFIKKVLRLLLNNLPDDRREFPDEIIREVKEKWTNDFNTWGKYLPCEPIPNNERSKNIYQDYLKRMKQILEIKNDISTMEDQLDNLPIDKETKRESLKNLTQENETLKQQIETIRAKIPR